MKGENERKRRNIVKQIILPPETIQADEWGEILASPYLFFTVVTGFEPYDWQEAFLTNDDMLETMRVSRQGGKSITAAVKVAREAILFDNQFIVIISPTREQSHIIFRLVKRIFEEIEMKFPGTVKQSLQTRIQLKNNSWVYVTSRTAVRGHTVTRLVVDEAAFVEDEIFTSARPALAASKGKLTLISTPYGKAGFFYESHVMEQFFKIHVPHTKIPHLNKDFIEAEKYMLTSAEFSQEYSAEFIETADNFLTREECLSLLDEDVQDVGKTPREDLLDHNKYDYYLGVDLARAGTDESAYTVLSTPKKGDEPIRIIHIDITSKAPATDAMGRIIQLHKAFKFLQIYVDESVIGGAVIDKLRIEDRLPITPINFAGKAKTSTDDNNKEAMYKNLKWLLEQNVHAAAEGRTKHLTGFLHQKLMNQLNALRYEYGSSGTLKVHHPEGGHDDLPDSLVLALYWCAGRKYYPLSTGTMSKSAGPVLGMPAKKVTDPLNLPFEQRLRHMRKIT